MSDLTPKVTGIGGIFFKTDDPAATKEWYGQNLGFNLDDFGCQFESRNIDQPEQINTMVWSPFAKNTKYFEPSAKDFMINYRVQNIEGLVQKLRENGVVILDNIETYEYGKFVHIMDPNGNKIELWESVDSVQG